MSAAEIEQAITGLAEQLLTGRVLSTCGVFGNKETTLKRPALLSGVSNELTGAM